MRGMDLPFRLRRSGRIDVLEGRLGGCDGARMLVTTRRGGASFSRGDLNLSFGSGDAREVVSENRRRLFGALGIPPSRVAGLKQRHSARVITVDERILPKAVARELEGDALVTEIPGIWLSISVGDCLAAVIFDPVRRVLAISHAGWSGTAARVVEATLSRMEEAYGCRPADLRAALGPCVGTPHYEVDEPVFERLRENWTGWEGFVCDCREGKGYLDLAAANRSLLLDSGVPEGNITDFGLCTYSLSALFSSHRREGASSGRMLVLATFSSP
jgi:YfiH family protein